MFDDFLTLYTILFGHMYVRWIYTINTYKITEQKFIYPICEKP